MAKEELTTAAVKFLLAHSTGALATQSVKHPGYPSTSSAPFSVGTGGSIAFFFSSLATHTKNLKSNSRSSLFVDGTHGDFSGSRLTIIGDVAASDEPREQFEHYFETHPQASQWASFGDFQFFVLKPKDVYFVAGFGSMGWIKGHDFTNAI